MPKKETNTKIKRYENNSMTKNVKKQKRKSVIATILIVLVCFAAGYFATTGILNALEKKKSAPSSSQTVSSQQTPQSSQTTQLPTLTPDSKSQSQSQPQSQTQSQSQTVPPQPVSAQNLDDRVYYYVYAWQISDEAKLAQVINNMKSAGANCLVFDLKDIDGHIHYYSNNRYAKKLYADEGEMIDIGTLLQKLYSENITPVARVYTYCDKLITDVDRSTSVFYRGTTMRWLDNTAEAGGKPWANPASEAMQKYILSLTDEIMSYGITDFIFAGFSTPTGYAKADRDFGTSEENVLRALKDMATSLRMKIVDNGGGTAMWEIDYSAAAQNKYEQYLTHPYNLGCMDYLITLRTADTNATTAFSNLQKDLSNANVNSITLWTDNSQYDKNADEIGGYFATVLP